MLLPEYLKPVSTMFIMTLRDSSRRCHVQWERGESVHPRQSVWTVRIDLFFFKLFAETFRKIQCFSTLPVIPNRIASTWRDEGSRADFCPLSQKRSEFPLFRVQSCPRIMTNDCSNKHNSSWTDFCLQGICVGRIFRLGESVSTQHSRCTWLGVRSRT